MVNKYMYKAAGLSSHNMISITHEFPCMADYSRACKTMFMYKYRELLKRVGEIEM